MSIELHIERLVIDATLLSGERAASVRNAIERDLARQLARPGAIDALRQLGSVDSLAPPLAHARDGCQRLGGRIAEAVGHGLGIDAGTNDEWKPTYAR